MLRLDKPEDHIIFQDDESKVLLFHFHSLRYIFHCSRSG